MGDAIELEVFLKKIEKKSLCKCKQILILFENILHLTTSKLLKRKIIYSLEKRNLVYIEHLTHAMIYVHMAHSVFYATIFLDAPTATYYVGNSCGIFRQ